MSAARDRLVRLFTDHFGSAPTAVHRVAADASSRTYLRLVGAGGESAIGATGPNHEENRAFLGFSRALRGAGLPVPEVYSADEAEGVWLAEDLGDETLLDALNDARSRTGEAFPRAVAPHFERALETLFRLQVEGARVVDFSLAYPRPDFDDRSILWDLNYFKYHYLKLAHVPFHEERLECDFQTLAEYLLEADRSHFLHRDFQARNIMLREGEPWFIDYQGARRGALQYDVASLLYSGSSGLPQEARERLLGEYLRTLAEGRSVDRERWEELYRGYALLRVMQTLGAYGYRGFFERRPGFTRRVSVAAKSIRELLAQGLPAALPELESVLARIVERWADRPTDAVPGVATTGSPQLAAGRLTVHLSSFSYRGGYPHEGADHGGGFVFDCRALPNPGREESYFPLSGLDDQVVEYLEREDRVAAFAANVRSLVEAQIDEYLRRGFSDLAIAFGCTGGQHRSVYMVEKTAEHLRERFPNVQVVTEHREALLWPNPP